MFIKEFVNFFWEDFINLFFSSFNSSLHERICLCSFPHDRDPHTSRIQSMSQRSCFNIVSWCFVRFCSFMNEYCIFNRIEDSSIKRSQFCLKSTSQSSFINRCLFHCISLEQNHRFFDWAIQNINDSFISESFLNIIEFLLVDFDIYHWFFARTKTQRTRSILIPFARANDFTW